MPLRSTVITRFPTVGSEEMVCAGRTDCAVNGKLYLGISVVSSRAELDASAPPSQVYPVKQPISGLGDEATLYKTDAAGKVRFLVVRKSDKGFTMAPFSQSISDEQLTQLAGKAVSR
jgi:hypothetical protein